MRQIIGCLVLALGLMVVAIPVLGQGKSQKPYSNYQEAEEICTILYYEGKYKEAIRVLEMAKGDFPGQYDEIIWSLAVNYCLDGQDRESMAAFKEALDKGVCIPDPSFYNYWKRLEKYPEFKKLRERNTALRKLAQTKSKPAFDVILPEGYDKGKSYPLFIALHGWGGNNNWFRMYWTSERLSKEFILVFMQSSQVVKTNGYSWDDIETARKEIRGMYDAVLEQYSIDQDKIYIGGFSQGGKASLDIAFEQTLPIKGFILLCPGGGIPEALKNPAAIERAQQTKLRAVIITGDKDSSVNEQNEVIAILKQSNIPHQFNINPNMYHWFPPDFPLQLDNALTFLESDAKMGED
jgi:predicted esterase